ncbi:hypothetical protein CV016_04250 [Yersinia kristensenii]|nr:hypothetical protein CV016_04250 [Yersinia kristensenii]
MITRFTLRVAIILPNRSPPGYLVLIPPLSLVFSRYLSSSNLLNIFIIVIRLCNEKKARNVLVMALAPHFS